MSTNLRPCLLPTSIAEDEGGAWITPKEVARSGRRVGGFAGERRRGMNRFTGMSSVVWDNKKAVRTDNNVWKLNGSKYVTTDELDKMVPCEFFYTGNELCQ
jgi:hypothetical protein